MPVIIHYMHCRSVSREHTSTVSSQVRVERLLSALRETKIELPAPAFAKDTVPYSTV